MLAETTIFVLSSIMSKMTITLLQTDIVWGDPERNIREAGALMDRCPGADLYVLPEMFSTGFCMHPEGVAEQEGGLSLRWMKEYAARHDCALAGSIAVKENEGYYNRFYFVYPDGRYACYDKRHLFAYGGEDRYYLPGHERVVVRFRGWRILLQICYDLRFPVWSRNRDDYDMVVYVANWPVPRMEVWKTLLHARAIENQCYVAGVNRVGEDPNCRYEGGTVLIDAYGREVAVAQSGVPDVVTGELHRELLDSFRKKFPVAADRDDFEIPLADDIIY